MSEITPDDLFLCPLLCRHPDSIALHSMECAITVSGTGLCGWTQNGLGHQLLSSQDFVPSFDFQRHQLAPLLLEVATGKINMARYSLSRWVRSMNMMG